MHDGGDRYASFVERELAAERARRETLDGRGQAVVTTSGALVALLGAVGAFVIGRTGFVLPPGARPWLLVALGCFAGASLFGILVTLPFKYDVPSRKALAALVQAHLTDSEAKALYSIVKANVTTIVTLRRGNNIKVLLLLTALTGQLAAAASLAVTVYLAVRPR